MAPRPSAAPVVAIAIAALLCASTAQASPVRMNELQVVGTHNSYHREISPVEQHAYEQLIGQPGDYAQYLAYTHVPLLTQLEEQHVRGGELDLWPDPQGGLYADPLVREKLGLGPLPDPAWRTAGIKVLHSADFDYNPSCIRFTTCLRQIRAWSRAHPRHVPLLYMLELKQSDIRAVSHGGVFAPSWDRPALDTMDLEIRSVFSDEELITADDCAGPASRSSSPCCATAGRRSPAAAASRVPARQRSRPDPRRLHCREPEPRGPRGVHQLASRPRRRSVRQAQRPDRRQPRADPGPRAARLPRPHAQRRAAADRAQRRHRPARRGAGQRRAAHLHRLPRSGHDRALRVGLRRPAARRRDRALQPRQRPARLRRAQARAPRGPAALSPPRRASPRTSPIALGRRRRARFPRRPR